MWVERWIDNSTPKNEEYVAMVGLYPSFESSNLFEETQCTFPLPLFLL